VMTGRKFEGLALGRIAVIARTEFLTTVVRKGYVLAVIGLPALIVAAAFAGMVAARAQVAAGRVGVVDQAHVLDLTWARDVVERLGDPSSSMDALRRGGNVEFESYASVERALHALGAGELVAVYVLPGDYLDSRSVEVYTRRRGLVLELARPGEGTMASLVRASLMGKKSDALSVARLVEPLQVREFRLTPEGDARLVQGELEKIAGLVLSFGVFLLFGLSIFLSSNYLLQSTAEEKENRLIEALLSIVRPGELLVGKLLGLGAAGLLQVAVYIAVFFVPAILSLRGVEVTLPTLLLSLLFFVLGFLLFASLMAAIGMLSSSVREGTQMATIWATISMVPLLLVQPITLEPDAGWVKVLSFFPLTSPLTMLVRLSMSMPAGADVIVAATVLLATIALSIWGGVKIFRVASLLRGKRITSSQVLRWIRES
jgi:ABC-2 type transport system permease protein